MCSCEDGERPRVFEQRLVKAHASRNGALHWCCECRRDIQLDEWHEDASGYWESWGRHRTCLRCVARRRAWAAVEDCTPPFGQLVESIRECLVTVNYDGVGRVRYIDRQAARSYLAELRAARTDLTESVARLEAQRSERRRAAAITRWRKPAPTHLGEGI